MKKNIVFLLAISSLIFFSCSKEPMAENGPQNGNINGNDNNTSGLKIEVVSGGGQADTVGRQLADYIVVKATQNGTPLSGYSVEFQGSGCNQDFPATYVTKADGTAAYAWSLASDVGQQTLKVYLLNSQQQKVDSVSTAATGIAAGKGWQIGACSIAGAAHPSYFAKLSTGKLFLGYDQQLAYLRYSNDNGASWYPVKSLGNSHIITWVMSTPSDELFVFTRGDGTFYSKDAGQTWTQFSTAPLPTQVTGGICTPKGILVVTNEYNVLVSTNGGRTWTSSASSPNSISGDSNFASPAADKKGNLYVVGRAYETIYKSTDNGATWAAVPKGGVEADFGFYVDNNGWFYKTMGDDSGAGIFISKNDGATYTLLISGQYNLIDRFTLQSDGNYYYDNSGLYRSLGLTSNGSLIAPVQLTPNSLPYIVAKNGNLVTTRFSQEVVYLPK